MRLGEKLRGGAIQERLETLAREDDLPSWLADDNSKTFFEMQVTEGRIFSGMSQCEAAICQTYTGGMLLYILYLEQSFYVTLEEVNTVFSNLSSFPFGSSNSSWPMHAL